MKCSLLLGILLLINTLAAFAQVPTHLWSNNIAESIEQTNSFFIQANDRGDVYSIGYSPLNNVDFDPSTNSSVISSSFGPVYLSKYDKDGNYIWAHKFNNPLFLANMELDEDGNIYVMGSFFATTDFDFSTTVNELVLTQTGGLDGFIAKYDPNGNLIWVKQMKASSNYAWLTPTAFLRSTHIRNGNIYIIGDLNAEVSFGEGAFSIQTSSVLNNVEIEGFVAKYDLDGNFIWVKQIRVSNNSSSIGLGITSDTFGNIYSLFSFSSNIDLDFNNPNTQVLTSPAVQIGFNYVISKYDSDGNFIQAIPIYSTNAYIPVNVTYYTWGISLFEINPFEEIVLMGVSYHNNDFDPDIVGVSEHIGGSFNSFLAKYDTNGNLIDRKQIVGIRNSLGRATSDAAGNLYSPFSYQGTVDIDLSATGTVNLTAVSPPFPDYSDLSMVSFDKDFNYLWHGQVFPQNDNNSYVSGSDLELDTKGNFYMSGQIRGTADFDMLAGVANVSSLGTAEPNAFLAKYGIPECSLNLKADTVVCGSSVSLTAPSGFTSYTWTFPDGTTTSTNPTIAANQTGIYYLDIVSRCGTARDSINVGFTPASTIDLGIDKQICAGNSTILNAPSGFTSYTWTLPNTTTSNSQNLTATTAGTYSLTVTNSCGTATDNIDITISPLPTVDLGIDKQICAGASTILNAPNGFTSYTWTLPNTTTSNSQNLTATAAGTYSLSVTDACGTATDDINVVISPLPTLDLGIDKQICAGNSTILNAPNGFTSYTWTLPNTTTSNSQNLTATAAGTYSLTVTDACGTATDNIDITISPLPTIDLGIDKQICAGSSTVLNAPSGFNSYTWTLPNTTTSNSQNLTATAAGTYSLTVTDACGTATDNIDITISPLPTIDLGIDKQICAGTSTVLNAPSGFTSYTWTLPNTTTSNSQNLTATAAGTYSLSVTDACGTATDDINVVVSPLPTVDLGIDKQICAGASTILNAPSGFTSYSWVLPNNSVSNLPNITVSEAGIYKLTVTNSCGAATDEIIVNVSPNPSLGLGNDIFTCQNDTTLIAPLGFDSYNWTFPNGTISTNPTITANQEGNYILEIENNCGNSLDTISVSFNKKPNIDLGIDTLLCQDEIINISLPVDYNYLWFDNDTSKTRSFSNAGIYYFDIINECGAKRDSIIINNFVEPVLDLGEDKLLCEDEIITISVNNPTNFPVLWNTGETTNSILVSEKGTYSVQLFSNCQIYSDSIQINYKNKPNLTPQKDTILCQNENYFVEIDSINNETTTIIWFDGNTDFSRSLKGEGIYFYTLSNECGSVSDTFSIILPNNDEINIDLGEDKILCNNESTLLNATNEVPKLTYLWNTGSTESQITVTETGTYIVKVSNLCTSKSDTIKINYIEEITTEIKLTQKNCGEAILNVELKENESIKWNDGSTETEFIPTKSGIYEAQVSNNCETKNYSIEVEIIDFEEAFPNVITPNDDGLNDAYVLPFEGAQIFVYDRWEKLVYRNDNYQNDWSPKNLTGGAYYLLIKHPCLNGNKKIVLSILK